MHEQVSVFFGGGNTGQSTGQTTQVVQGGDEAMQSALQAGSNPIKRDMPKVSAATTPAPAAAAKSTRSAAARARDALEKEEKGKKFHRVSTRRFAFGPDPHPVDLP